MKLRIPTVECIHYLEIGDIVRIQSYSNYSRVFLTNGKSLLASRILGHFDNLLTGYNFVRVHRTHLVNLSYVKGYENRRKISLRNNEVLPVAKSRNKALLEGMKQVTINS